MPGELSIDREHSAVLIMDYQTTIVAGYGTDQAALLRRAEDVLKAAREAKLPVIYVVVGFRPGYPEVSPRNATFSSIKQAGRLVPGESGSEIHSSVAPQAGDLTVVKHRTGAFSGTDPEMILRAKGVDTLILFGIATSGVVLSTVRYAADSDYRLVVVKDCCSDQDAEVHNCLTGKIFPRQATVITAEELIRALQR
jgi:nicotinamidase-related amidase